MLTKFGPKKGVIEGEYLIGEDGAGIGVVQTSNFKDSWANRMGYF